MLISERVDFRRNRVERECLGGRAGGTAILDHGGIHFRPMGKSF